MCQNKLSVKIGERISPFSGKSYPIYEYVPCRKCEECVSIRKSQWCFRALAEAEHAFNSVFLTLTYSDDCLPDGANVCLRDVQLFFKRMRKNISLWYPDFDTDSQTGYPLKYFCCSEYGSKKQRPHYHMILWNCPMSSGEIERTWKLGFIKVKPCIEPTVQYTLKYFACKDFAPEGRVQNFCVMSKNIGREWLSDNLYYDKTYVTMPGKNYKIPIPPYYRDRLPHNYPKREYYWNSQPIPYERFSPKFLKSRRLLTRRTLVNDMPIDKFNRLCEDADNYYLYRDASFKRKYKSMMSKDNQ